MREIVLFPRQFTFSLARELEERKLVSFISHPNEAIRGSLAKNYLKSQDFPMKTCGFHSVTITHTEIHLASHSRGQDEIVFNWDDSRQALPLYFVFARHKRDRYLNSLTSGKVAALDYIVFGRQ